MGKITRENLKEHSLEGWLENSKARKILVIARI